MSETSTMVKAPSSASNITVEAKTAISTPQEAMKEAARPQAEAKKKEVVEYFEEISEMELR